MTRSVVIISALAAVFIAAPVAGSGGGYIGSKGCMGCHEGEADAWNRGPHVRAGAPLATASVQEACTPCHATGDAPVGRVVERSVGCEACHGAGRGYAPDDIMRDRPLARALGLANLSTPTARKPVCMRCHRVQLGDTPFDPEAAWKRLPHARRP